LNAKGKKQKSSVPEDQLGGGAIESYSQGKNARKNSGQVLRAGSDLRKKIGLSLGPVGPSKKKR